MLHILRAPLGGAFRHVFDLALSQSRRGLKVGLVCDQSTDDAGIRRKLAELEACCELGVTRVSIPRNPGRGDAAVFRSLRALCAQLSPDVLHGHGAKGMAYARLLARETSARSVCTPHGGALHYSYSSVSGAAFLLLERALKRFTDAMIFESEYAKRTYEQKLGAITFPHKVILNGLYAEEFVPICTEHSQYDFVFVGEYRALKGIFTIVDAARLLKGRHNVRILMVGSGPDESELRQRISAAGLSEEITVSGPIHPARKAFAMGRFIVAPSTNESMPYLILEAIAARIPLITTRVGGIPEVFGPYVDELLVPGDSDMLADRLASLLQDPSRAYQIAGALHEHARRHLSVDQMESKISSFYAEVCAGQACSSKFTNLSRPSSSGQASIDN